MHPIAESPHHGDPVEDAASAGGAIWGYLGEVEVADCEEFVARTGFVGRYEGLFGVYDAVGEE